MGSIIGHKIDCNREASGQRHIPKQTLTQVTPPPPPGVSLRLSQCRKSEARSKTNTEEEGGVGARERKKQRERGRRSRREGKGTSFPGFFARDTFVFVFLGLFWLITRSLKELLLYHSSLVRWCMIAYDSCRALYTTTN